MKIASGEKTSAQTALNAAALLLLTIAILFSSSSWAGECLKDSREVKLGEEVARLRSYMCNSEDGRPLVHVDFQRLDLIAAGSLIKGPLLPPITRIFGDASFIINKLYTQVSDLFNRFGQTYEIQLGGTGEKEAKFWNNQTQGKIWHLAQSGQEFTLPDEAKEVETGLGWSSGFLFFLWSTFP
jgi:hypothetical protein